MPIICHITTADLWNEAKGKGFYETASLQTEGFIHCSEVHQVPEVLNRYFKGKGNLVKLVIDTNCLTSRLIYEWSPSTQDTFPHVYGTINLEAVINVEAVHV